jgi:hypothetical protein
VIQILQLPAHELAQQLNQDQDDEEDGDDLIEDDAE